MNIALHCADKKQYPNLVLMKLSAWHKKEGDKVEWFNATLPSDIIYSSKIFTWSENDPYLPEINTKYGGTGYRNGIDLPDTIEHICPDYSLYGLDYSMGFLTRGCIRKCEWCFVPEKEGKLKPHADIDEFARHDKVVLLDNNVLASEYGISQIEKIIKLGLKVDFNQGLDARLIDDRMASLLAKVKWLAPLRLACDTQAQMPSIQKAVSNLRWNNCTPVRYFCYVLIKDIDEALERIRFLKGLMLDPFAQPYRDKEGTPPTQEQRELAKYVNTPQAFRSMTWDEWKNYRGI